VASVRSKISKNIIGFGGSRKDKSLSSFVFEAYETDKKNHRSDRKRKKKEVEKESHLAGALLLPFFIFVGSL
jgi:hypothetical protein